MDANSRSRVVRPMLKNANVKAQVRNACKGADQRRQDFLLVGGVVKSARHQGDDGGGHQKPQHEFGKAIPNLRGARFALDPGALPARRRDQREHEGPDADPDIASDDFHERERADRRIRRSGNSRHVAGVAAVGLRRGQARRVGEFRRADPGAGDAGGQTQRPGDQRQHEYHDDGPERPPAKWRRKPLPFARPPRRRRQSRRTRRTPRRRCPGWPPSAGRAPGEPLRHRSTPKVANDTMAACTMATGPAQAISVSGRPAPSSTMPVLM